MMWRTFHIAFALLFTTASLAAQESDSSRHDRNVGQRTIDRHEAQENDSSHHNLRFSGQLSGWGSFTPDTDTKAWLGGRYIPQINYGYSFSKNRLFDLEASANLFGDIGFRRFDDAGTEGKIKPYRLWMRYSTARSEVRLGLQKINFGSAQLFRPLMWFDAMDPRDPLQMTDGVWAALFRYYFQNNANVWIWTLAGNKTPKGWDTFETNGRLRPEAGGRVQLPFTSGETALSYHFRKAELPAESYNRNASAEHKLGFDIRADVVVGLWLETSWTHYARNIGALTNQHMLTVGADYTFDIGNGLGITGEHMLYGTDNKAFRPSDNINFTGISLNYPFTLFDDISLMLYYDWRAGSIYSFANWQHQWDNLSLYVIGFWNPKTYAVPGRSDFARLAGKGIQLMLVWNH